MTQIKGCRVPLGGLLAVVAASCVLAQPTPTTPPTAEAERGRAVYVSKGCYECHGLAAQGAVGVGPPLSPQRLGLPAFEAYVRGPSGQMPPYGAAVLPKAELEDIFTYLQSLPAARRAAQIPMLAPYVTKFHEPVAGTHASLKASSR